MTGDPLDRRPNEAETEYADRLTRAYMDTVAARYDGMRDRVLNAAGWTFRMARQGYGAHFSSRDSQLPEDIKAWIKKGCPE